MKNYQTPSTEAQKGRLEQLTQLLQITFDGDLINKTERDKLQQMGYCATVLTSSRQKELNYCTI